MISIFTNIGTTILLVGAILLGALLGWAVPALGVQLGGWVDPLILGLVSVLFFEVNLLALSRAGRHWRCLSLAWVCNFLIIPTLGFLIASLFLRTQPLFFTGLLIYFIAPCTDWFLGFTRLARGNTALGSVLLPLNLLSQLLLYPVYLGFFAGQKIGASTASLGGTLWQWFLLPFLGAVAAHQLMRRLLPARLFERLLALAGRAVPLLIAALVVCIFAANIATILAHAGTFLLILAAVFLFFIATWFLAESASRLFKLAYPEHALLTMTTAARNAPLMLGVTIVALPEQPLIYAALIIGMLVEFPHLTALKHLLLRRADVPPPSTPESKEKEPSTQDWLPSTAEGHLRLEMLDSLFSPQAAMMRGNFEDKTVALTVQFVPHKNGI
jgi:ACR3 family arsenite transporter